MSLFFYVLLLGFYQAAELSLHLPASSKAKTIPDLYYDLIAACMQRMYVYPLTCGQYTIHYCLCALVLVPLRHSIHSLLINPVPTIQFS